LEVRILPDPPLGFSAVVVTSFFSVFEVGPTDFDNFVRALAIAAGARCWALLRELRDAVRGRNAALDRLEVLRREYDLARIGRDPSVSLD